MAPPRKKTNPRLDAFDNPLDVGDLIAVARGRSGSRVEMVRGRITRITDSRIYYRADRAVTYDLPAARQVDLESWTQPHLAVRIATEDLEQAVSERDRYRYALRSAVGNPADTAERMTLPRVRELAGLDPDTGRPTEDADVTAEQAPDLPALAVPCTFCGSAAGELCTSHGGSRIRRTDAHQARTHAYRDAQQ